ncbi:MAG: hypothetical protein NVS1B10_06660 [Candidatus Saccharimonadales bacterium]
MLPFLKPKQAASTIVANRKPSGAVEMASQPEHSPELLAHAQKLTDALHAKDIPAVAEHMTALHKHLNASKEASNEPAE